MKRLLIAAVLLVLTVTLCAVCANYLTSRIDRLTSDLDALIVTENDMARQKAAQKFAEKFQKSARIFALYIPNERLEDTAESVAVLPSLTNDPLDFSKEVARCRHLLSELKKSEELTPENIF